MKIFDVTFTYNGEFIQIDYEMEDGDTEDDVQYQVEYEYEHNAFYDNNYVQDLEITER